MTGRFAPVPANDPYAGETDTPDSYEKRIKPLVQAMLDADALPYLFNQLPSDLEMRVRIANPATVNAFFTDLRNIWHESAGKRIQAPVEDPEDSEEYIVEEEEDPEEEEIEDDDEYVEYVDENDDEPRNCYATKKKCKAPISKASSNIIMATDQMYQIALKSIIASVVPHCPKEILIEISKFINAIEPKLKDHCLNTVMPNDTVKRRELAWENVTSKVQDVLLPLMQATNAEQKLLLQVPDNKESIQSASNPNEGIVMADSTKIKEINTTSTSHVLPENHALAPSTRLEHAIKAYATAQKKNSQIYWPKPLEINFLQIKDADDVATISCKVGSVTIPYAMIDSGSDSSIVSENVAKHLGLKIDKKKIHRLNGVASKSHSLGTVDSVPVTIEDGENRDTIPDEFSVVPTEYDDNGKELSLFILGTQWQYRAGWEPLVKGEFRVSRNGKTITIPLSVHKSQRNVFTVAKEPEEWFPIEPKKN
ncbi:hypothetical protein C1646_761176 [Rhizophagus diaphanus]|nr:hypothetical protein C1646_761176 [Rhizophagus diaphanus] [Rhizophagus sp. MUCL 43196]